MSTNRRLSLYAAPAIEPVTVEEAKAHCRISVNDEDALLTRLIKVGRSMVEERTQRALITQTWDAKYDAWPCVGLGGAFELPLAPLQSVTSITYVDTDGTTQTWDSASYQVSAPSGPIADRGRVALAYGYYFPVLRTLTLDAVRIRFVCGYGTAASSVPEDLRTAILFLVHEMYDRRAETVQGQRSPNVIAADALCAPFSVRRF